MMTTQFGEPLIHSSLIIYLEILFDPSQGSLQCKEQKLLKSASVKWWLLFRDEETDTGKELKEVYLALTEVESHQAALLSLHCFWLPLLSVLQPVTFFGKALCSSKSQPGMALGCHCSDVGTSAGSAHSSCSLVPEGLQLASGVQP